HNEVHARPAEAEQGPAAITHLVMLADAQQREQSRQHLATLMHDHHRTGPDADCTHLRMDFGAFRLRWELHTEFVCWTFMVPLPADAPLNARSPACAIEEVPQQWLKDIPGLCLSSVHLWIVQDMQCEHKGIRH